MAGTLNGVYIQAFRQQFEQNCISLLLDGYKSLRSSGRDMTSCEENDITVQIIGFMKANPLAGDLQISISRESYLDGEATYAGKAKANNSPRIDIKFGRWHFREEVEYTMEAKNLVKSNWHKPGRRTPVSALHLQKRYIKTGIDHFVSDKYVNGCLIGYVLEGNIGDIVHLINGLLSTDRREKEWLMKQEDHGFEGYYLSQHDSASLALKHFFLPFCN